VCVCTWASYLPSLVKLKKVLCGSAPPQPRHRPSTVVQLRAGEGQATGEEERYGDEQQRRRGGGDPRVHHCVLWWWCVCVQTFAEESKRAFKCFGRGRSMSGPVGNGPLQ
jgi:hypothetical protein